MESFRLVAIMSVGGGSGGALFESVVFHENIILSTFQKNLIRNIKRSCHWIV